MRDIVYAPLFVRLGSRLRGPKQVTQVGTARRILISNITSNNAGSRVSSIFSGIPGYSIEDVKIANVLHQHKGGGTAEMAALVPPENETKYPDPGMFGTTASHGFFFRHVNRLELSHVEIQPMTPDARPILFAARRASRRLLRHHRARPALPPSRSTRSPTCASSSAAPRPIPTSTAPTTRPFSP